MRKLAKQTLQNFAVGVVTGMQPDAIPAEASPRAWNNILLSTGGGHAIPGKRRGALRINSTALSGTPIVHGQAVYNRRSGANLTQYHLIITDNGKLYKLSSGTLSAADAGTPTPFTSGDYLPSTATANNLCFFANGVDLKKFDGTSVTGFGITRPTTVGFTAVDSGTAGTPNGTYEFAISYGNSSTGHESSRSDVVSVSVVSKKITVNWATPSDAQVDQVFLHVRKPSINAQFFRLTAGCTPSPSSTTGAFGNTSDPITVDVSDTQLNALLTLSPDTAENDPPPAGIISLVYHQSRMFALDRSTLYWSKVGKPESFDPDSYDYVNKDDSRKLTVGVSAFGQLVVFKDTSMYVLGGTDPDTWRMDLVDPRVGCIAPKSVCFVNGYLYWWSQVGPARWNGSGPVELLGQAFIAPTVNADALNISRLDHACAEVDYTRERVLFAVPTYGSPRNDIILPYNYRASGWDSDRWDPFDVASMVVVQDSSGSPWVYMGNYGGRVFQWWNADLDGAQVINGAGTTLTLTGAPTAHTTTTLTDSGATFDTDGSGLAECYVVLTDAEGVRVRRRIVSNTSTVLTINADMLITPILYTIATPDWQYDTKWLDFGDPFIRKHLIWVTIQATSSTGAAQLTADIYRDWNLTTVQHSCTVTAAGGGATWDTSTWDVGKYADSASMAEAACRVGKTGRTFRLRVTNHTPNTQVALAKLVLEVQPQGAKR